MAVQRIIIETGPTTDDGRFFIGYAVEGPKHIKGAWGDEAVSRQSAYEALRDQIRVEHPRTKFHFIHAAL